MSNTNGTISYQSIYVNSGITANVISATTISANTFYGGSLSASFIGNRDVNDQQFKYISGITSDTQTQLNTKRFFNEPFIVSGTPSGLFTAKTLVGDGIVLNENGSTIELNATIKNLVLNTITISSGISENELNFNPNGWDTSPLESASFIVITQNGIASIISGLVGGTPGRVCVIRNGSSKSLFVFEHDSHKTNTQNRFLFSDGEAYFLQPGQNITLIYNGLGVWTNLYTLLKQNKYRNYVDFGNTKFRNNGQTVGASLFTTGIPNFASVNMTTQSRTFLDSNDCVVLNYNNANGCTIRPLRADYPGTGDTSLLIGKISLNTDTGWDDNTRFIFGMSTASQGNRGGAQTAALAYTSFSWATPPSVTTDPTVWHRCISTTFVPTDLKLSSTTNSWVYLVNYSSTSPTTETATICQLYSFDFKIFTISSNIAVTGGKIYNIWFKSTNALKTNGAFIDELMFTTNNNYY